MSPEEKTSDFKTGRTAGLEHIDDQQLARELLQNNDLLLEKICAALDTNATRAERALQEALRFMFLISISDQVLTPSHRVDLAWHEFILNTRSYHEFCQRHFGRYLHHSPGGTQEGNRRQFQRTIQLYRNHFGTPDEYFWGQNGLDLRDEACGACETI